jgi:hypothetical protein
MPHQQVRRLAAARPKPSGIASVSEISYRRVLRAGSRQEILRAEMDCPRGVFKNPNRYPVQPRVGNSNLFESGDPKNGRSWSALGMSETARSTGRHQPPPGSPSCYLVGSRVAGVLLPKIYMG